MFSLVWVFYIYTDSRSSSRHWDMFVSTEALNDGPCVFFWALSGHNRRRVFLQPCWLTPTESLNTLDLKIQQQILTSEEPDHWMFGFYHQQMMEMMNQLLKTAPWSICTPVIHTLNTLWHTPLISYREVDDAVAPGLMQESRTHHLRPAQTHRSPAWHQNPLNHDQHISSFLSRGRFIEILIIFVLVVIVPQTRFIIWEEMILIIQTYKVPHMIELGVKNIPGLKQIYQKMENNPTII